VRPVFSTTSKTISDGRIHQSHYFQFRRVDVALDFHLIGLSMIGKRLFRGFGDCWVLIEDTLSNAGGKTGWYISKVSLGR
jgi:hypothetical protein